MMVRIIAILLIITSSISFAIRAGLDFTFKLKIGDLERVVTCDICNFSIEERGVYFQTRSVNSSDGYVEVIFFKNNQHYNVDYSSILKSNEKIIDGSLYQVIRIKEGQTLKLKNTDIEFTLLDASGAGCPKGAMC